jgi:hypothetical protein
MTCTIGPCEEAVDTAGRREAGPQERHSISSYMRGQRPAARL